MNINTFYVPVYPIHGQLSYKLADMLHAMGYTLWDFKTLSRSCQGHFKVKGQGQILDFSGFWTKNSITSISSIKWDDYGTFPSYLTYRYLWERSLCYPIETIRKVISRSKVKVKFLIFLDFGPRISIISSIKWDDCGIIPSYLNSYINAARHFLRNLMVDFILW